MNARNPYQVRFNRSDRSLDLIDTRARAVIRVFELAERQAAEAYATDLWIEEASREAQTLPATDVAPWDLPAPEPVPALSPEQAAMDAALMRLGEDAQRREQLATAEGDRDGAAIARRCARAYTRARALVLGAGVAYVGRAYQPTPDGALLVRSATTAGQWYAVKRTTTEAGWNRLTCTCQHGRSGAVGICTHIAVTEAYEALQDTDADLAARVILAA